MKTLFISLLIFSFSGLTVFADEVAPLDPPYQNLQHPKVVKKFIFADATIFRAKPKVTVETVIAQQSPVKSQIERGTCSIFSATALLEHLLIKRGDTNVDLSEEWLQYLVSQGTSSEGSYSSKNFDLLMSYGSPAEETLPYIGAKWNDLNAVGAQERCGHLAESPTLPNCLVAHRDPALLKLSDEYLLDFNSSAYDPQFYFARTEAKQNKEKFFKPTSKRDSLWNTAVIKERLDQGVPVILDISFYYGAWNHRVAEELGINRDMDLWAQGIVTYPEDGTMDRQMSPTKTAGHSVVIVGYDDDRVIEFTTNMADGTMKTFKRKGVYYFKNSWGASNFGVTTTIGNQIYSGYGVITQDYANQYGGFHTLTLE